MTDCDELYSLVEDLITGSTPMAYDDGIQDVTDLIEDLPDDLQPYGEVWVELDQAMAALIVDDVDESTGQFNNGVCDASVAAQKFFRKLENKPKWHISEPFQLGADVQDGYEGRMTSVERWMAAEECRGYGTAIFEVRPVKTYLVSLPEGVVRAYAEGAESCNAIVVAEACRKALEGGL